MIYNGVFRFVDLMLTTCRGQVEARSEHKQPSGSQWSGGKVLCKSSQRHVRLRPSHKHVPILGAHALRKLTVNQIFPEFS